eukprot:755758-Hanusia_phi.AAC.2
MKEKQFLTLRYRRRGDEKIRPISRNLVLQQFRENVSWDVQRFANETTVIKTPGYKVDVMRCEYRQQEAYCCSSSKLEYTIYINHLSLHSDDVQST